ADGRRRRLVGGARALPGAEARLQGADEGAAVRLIEIRTLTDGGQTPVEIARALTDFVSAAERTLDVAIYDFRLADEPERLVAGALADGARRPLHPRLRAALGDAGRGEDGQGRHRRRRRRRPRGAGVVLAQAGRAACPPDRARARPREGADPDRLAGHHLGPDPRDAGRG